MDGYSQATRLTVFNVPPDIKKIHIDALATNDLGPHVGTWNAIEHQFKIWSSGAPQDAALGALTQDQMRQFVTTPLAEGGLGLSAGYYESAEQFSALNYGIGPLNSDWGFFLGNKLGSLGETSTLACLIGAAILIWTGVASWRTMLSMALGAFITAFLFEMGAKWLAADQGAWTPAQFAFPAYKHLLLGGLAFGLVFMATDPVSSPSQNLSKWIYGAFCGLVTIVIRVINPAYPEGVMLAILMGNVFAPLIDHYVVLFQRKRSLKRVRTT